MRIAREIGRMQIVYGGKAHAQDEGAKLLIRHVFEASEQLKDTIRIVYLEDYDMHLAQLLTSGVDLWLNTPLRPYEASGTFFFSSRRRHTRWTGDWSSDVCSSD